LLFLVTAEADESLYFGRESYLDWISAVIFTHLNLQLPFSFTLYLGFYERVFSHISPNTLLHTDFHRLSDLVV